MPVGVPATALPLTITPSVVESPSSIEPSAGVDVVVLWACVTVKHSVVDASLDPR